MWLLLFLAYGLRESRHCTKTYGPPDPLNVDLDGTRVNSQNASHSIRAERTLTKSEVIPPFL